MATKSHHPGVTILPSGKKVFIPLENNPEVFTSLIHSLGVSSALEFHDVYSLTDPDLLSFIPRPVHALIFIAPGSVYYRLHDKGKPKVLTYTGHGQEEPVWWCKQTIGHSCGLMALLHSIANGEAKKHVASDSLAGRLLAESTPLPPMERAAVLYDSAELEQAHMAAAVMGDSKAPSSTEPNGYHFLAFVPGKDGKLWECDGSWDGPIDHGILPEGADMLNSKVIGMGINKYLAVSEGNLEYSLVALTGNPASQPDTNGAAHASTSTQASQGQRVD
ncbi:hypothetical protein B0A48_04059 [Cryoendolithus antarcticus]|uniref:Ubiquitin carboxyl-terminal hydrolase n=1 Tax=Cryoendolithus antarcticus TaxID=1507870 RepID=A0A1V8TH92_9PEZI|nr:hypothetical protein B0A48_04059 [Cryoendolithus antarcticus]